MVESLHDNGTHDDVSRQVPSNFLLTTVHSSSEDAFWNKPGYMYVTHIRIYI